MTKMEMIAGVVDVLENYDLRDLAGKEGYGKWKDEVKARTRPFLEEVYNGTVKEVGKGISAKYYEGPKKAKKACESFDHCTIEIESIHDKELSLGIWIGSNSREVEPKAIYVGLSTWGNKEVIKEIKDILDDLLEKEGKLLSSLTFRGGVSLGYFFLVRGLEVLQLARSSEEANVLIQEMAEKLAEAIRIVKSNHEKIEEINKIVQESRSKRDKKKDSEKENEAERNKGNLLFREDEVHAFITALLTKPFVILSGVSGTGKTQLARVVAQEWAKKPPEVKGKSIGDIARKLGFNKTGDDYYQVSSSE